MIPLVEAECAIRQLHARYADAVWRQDVSAFAECFADDAVWRVGGLELTGRAAIAAGFAGFMASIERTLMTFRTPIVTLGADGASARTYVTEQNKYADGTAAMSIGIYYEQFAVDRDGAWRFAWRHWQMYYHGPADLSGAIHPAAEFGAPPGMPGAGDRALGRAELWP
jgi:uncharacterized protein (TIGR02246 family)